MPKIIELTVELEVQKVSCPGVWLCQDGRVSLTVFALGTSYQTCLLPPVFPLTFRDVFYFRKRFRESCTLNNICCILKDETIYCELVQWSNDCARGECTVLAQYLGALNDVLFPPNMCSNEGVDLLMRRSKDFPGILSPKIEIATKVRIDEVWDEPCNIKSLKAASCHCKPHDADASRQRQVCHTPEYHRSMCNKRPPIPRTQSRISRSRSRSGGSRSCCSLDPEPDPKDCDCTPMEHKRSTSARAHSCVSSAPSRVSLARSRVSLARSRVSLARACVSPAPSRSNVARKSKVHCECRAAMKRSKKTPPPRPRSRSRGSVDSEQSRVNCVCRPSKSRLFRSLRGRTRRRQYCVYTAQAPAWPLRDASDDRRSSTGSERAKPSQAPDPDRLQKLILESRYISHEPLFESKLKDRERYIHKHFKTKISPCVCEICRRYHELFHSQQT